MLQKEINAAAPMNHDVISASSNTIQRTEVAILSKSLDIVIAK